MKSLKQGEAISHNHKNTFLYHNFTCSHKLRPSPTSCFQYLIGDSRFCPLADFLVFWSIFTHTCIFELSLFTFISRFSNFTYFWCMQLVDFFRFFGKFPIYTFLLLAIWVWSGLDSWKTCGHIWHRGDTLSQYIH